MFSLILFHLETVTTKMTYTTYLSACFTGALVILAYSWNISYTLDISMTLILFPHEKSCRIGCKCNVCGKSFEMKCYIRIHTQKSTKYFLVPRSRFQHFGYLLQNLKP